MSIPQRHRTTLYLATLLLGLVAGQFIFAVVNIALAAGGLFLFLAAWQWPHQRRRLMLLCAALFLFGAARAGYEMERVQAMEKAVPTGEVIVRGVIVAEVKQQDAQQEAILGRVDFSGTPWAGRLRVYMPLYPALAYGQEVRLRCEMQTRAAGDSWRVLRLRGKNIQAQCGRAEAVRILGEGQGNALLQRLLDGKAVLTQGAARALPSPHAELLAGLLLGSKSSMPSVVQEQFRRAGLSHIVVLSGYNISIVVMVAFGLCVRVGLSRRRAFFILLLATAAFIASTGAESSAVRAGIMAAVALSARQFGRLTSPAILLLSTAAAMAVFRPFILLGDVGFHLSFAATAGLMYGSEPLQRRLRFIPTTFGLRDALATTLAATLATLPIMLVELQRVSLVTLAANVLVGPIIPLTMALGTVAIAAGIISSVVGVWFGLPAWVLLEYILRVAEFFASPHWAQVQILN